MMSWIRIVLYFPVFPCYVFMYAIYCAILYAQEGLSYERRQIIICGDVGRGGSYGVYLLDSRRVDSSRIVYVYIFTNFSMGLAVVNRNGMVESVLVIRDLRQDECIVVGSNETRRKGLFVIGVEFCDRINKSDFVVRSERVNRAWLYRSGKRKGFVRIRAELLVRFNEGYYERRRVTGTR